MKIIADIPLNPISLNHLYWHRAVKGKGFFKIITTKGKAFKKEFETHWRNKVTDPMFMKEIRLNMKLIFTFPTKRLRDLDNALKVTLDSLEGLGFENDSQIDELHIYRAYKKDLPNIHIEIEETKESGTLKGYE